MSTSVFPSIFIYKVLIMTSYLLSLLFVIFNNIINSFTDFYSFTFGVFFIVLALAPNRIVPRDSLSL